MLRIDRHRLGPRVYVLGARVHEWHLGAALLLLLGVGAAFDRLEPGVRTVVPALLGLWLVAKDWRDLVPSRRDTAAWRLGLHAVPAPLRAVRRGDPLPQLAALGTGLAGLVNLASAVTPNIGWRDELLLQFAPLAALRVSHAAAVPASLLLLVAAPYLWRRRVGALRLAVALLVGLGVLNLLKGLDLEEAAASFALAAVLCLGRGSFYVRHDPTGLRTALSRLPLVAGGGLLFCGLAVWLAAPESASLGSVLRQTVDALLWQPGPIDFRDELGFVDEAVALTGALVLASCFWMILRPLAAPRTFPDLRLRKAAARLVRRHGSDTLAYFKLRRDQHYLFSANGQAFLGYRGRGRRSARLRRPDRARRGDCRLAARAELVCRGTRPADRGPRCRRTNASALAPARAENALPRGRGARRHARVLTRGPRHPQGSPVGVETREGRLFGDAQRPRTARRAAPRRARASQPQLARRQCRAGLRHVAGRTPARGPRR